MSEIAVNPLRKWRNGRELNLDQACELFAKHGYPISSAKLSRIERDQSVPVEMLPAIEAITDIPAKELRPDLAKIFDGANQ